MNLFLKPKIYIDILIVRFFVFLDSLGIFVSLKEFQGIWTI